MPGGEDFMQEAGLGDLGRPDRAAEPVVALQYADAPARLREQRRSDQRVDSAPDRDCVVAAGHPRRPSQTRSKLSRARRASSPGSTSQSESANASPKVPLSEKISTSYQPS